MKELYNRVISIVSDSDGKTFLELIEDMPGVPIVGIMDCLMVAVGFRRLFAVHSGKGWTDEITYTSQDHKQGIANHSRYELLIENIRLGQERPDVVSEREWKHLKDLCRLCGEINSMEEQRCIYCKRLFPSNEDRCPYCKRIVRDFEPEATGCSIQAMAICLLVIAAIIYFTI